MNGFYRASVASTSDPLSRGRVRLIVPSVFGEVPTGWAEPMMNFVAPVVGDAVWACFEAGDPDHPLYLARWAGVHEHVDTLHTTVEHDHPHSH